MLRCSVPPPPKYVRMSVRRVDGLSFAMHVHTLGSSVSAGCLSARCHCALCTGVPLPAENCWSAARPTLAAECARQYLSMCERRLRRRPRLALPSTHVMCAHAVRPLCTVHFKFGSRHLTSLRTSRPCLRICSRDLASRGAAPCRRFLRRDYALAETQFATGLVLKVLPFACMISACLCHS